MGSNGIVTENAQHNIDMEKFKENHKKIFGERIKTACKYCDLSSKQKKGENFTCPHCKKEN